VLFPAIHPFVYLQDLFTLLINAFWNKFNFKTFENEKKTKINNHYKASLLSIATMQDKSAIRKS
jgi:hypothetical protein